jgi:hypothetical protein
LLLQAATEEGFTGFDGMSLVLLVAGCIAAGVVLAMYALIWLSSRPRFPEAGAPTADLGPEPPAVANFLVNRWNLTRVAMSATLADLAGRRVLGLEDYAGGRHVVRIRSNQPEGEQFTPYEQQVLDLVRNRATGGSAPVEALDLGQSDEAQKWWKRFRKAVEKDAEARGLARPRFTRRHKVLLGTSLAVALLFFGLALATAHVGEGWESDDGEEFNPWSWLLVAGVAWLGASAWFARSGPLRETGAGREACARWLGVRQYLRSSGTFGDLPPGAVAVWGRYLAYAAGFGLARATSRALPFATDDPETAWSRYGGTWHQVRIRYPKRFGFGESPIRVFLVGLGLTAFWGFIGFFLLPVAANLGWDAGKEALDDSSISGTRTEVALIIGVVVVVLGMGLYVLAQLINGVVRLVRGALDLGRTVTVTGEVANIYRGRVALADGVVDSVRAWTPPPGAPPLRRGQVARVTMSPRLCHVTKVEVLQEPEAPEPAAAAAAAAVGPAGEVPDAAALSAITGVVLSSLDGTGAGAQGAEGLAARTFSDGHDGVVRIYLSPEAGALTGFFGLLARMPGPETVEVAGAKGSWVGGRVLSVPLGKRLLGVEIELPQLTEEQRREAATRIALHVVGTPATTPTEASG